jgi:23S rRNA pseudouridine2605 synthase
MSQKKSNSRTGLARALSKMGYCSRSAAARLVTKGRVRVNGCQVRDPEFRVLIKKDKIAVNRHEVKTVQKVYFMLNKPRGLVTSASDEQGRATVYSLMSKYRQWLAPVGRLDKASEGLLLFTNDSQWASRIASPETHLDKTYHVQVGTLANETILHRVTTGITSTDGGCLRAKSASIVRHGNKNCWLEIVLDEGKNRHIRQMFSALGIEVLRLVRIGIGSLRLRDLPKGAVRELSAQEKNELDSAISGKPGKP